LRARATAGVRLKTHRDRINSFNNIQYHIDKYNLVS